MQRSDPFQKVDSDGDGSVNQSELESFAAQIEETTGQTLDVGRGPGLLRWRRRRCPQRRGNDFLCGGKRFCATSTTASRRSARISRERRG